MILYSLSVQKTLETQPITASAPCRIDAGGTWDIKAMSLPFERIEPITINIALNLRTEVILSPFQNGRVKIIADGFNHAEDYSFDSLSFNSTYGLFFAAVAHFGFHGLFIRIQSDSPVKSGLGGSSTALIALLKALSKLSTAIHKNKSLSSRDILHLGYYLEDGISGGHCGMQDQAAAVYGGVNLWKWTYAHRKTMVHRESLLKGRVLRELSKRLLVAYSGKSHISSDINHSWMRDFLSAKTRSGWVAANEKVFHFGQAIKEQDWKKAIKYLKAEMAIRRDITPDALISDTGKMIDQAEALGCGARFAGAGGGGSIWALGDPNSLHLLRSAWERTLDSSKEGKLLDCSIDSMGVR